MLSQLIYASIRTEKCPDSQVDKIMESSTKNNKHVDITGVLLYSKSKFLQVIEGEKTHILKLYDDIKKDDRHKNIAMISLKPIDERYFPSWQMGSRKIDDQFNFLTDMDEKTKSDFKKLLNGEAQNDAIKIIHKLFA